MSLPVASVLPDLLAAMARGDAILEAPPGAGKTTLVPLALAEAPFSGSGKIVVLEPRRLAAKSAAHRMASLLGEPVGKTVGYRMRLETVVGPDSRIEVVTEGVLTRMLQSDPSLDGIAAVLFDEFHERSLDADLALSLVLKGRELFRADDPLKLLVMSATLDTDRVAELLPGAPVIRTEGRLYPVEIVYGQASTPHDRVDTRMTEALRLALGDNPDSSILAFLPGQGEIRRVAEALGNPVGVDVIQLYGNLTLDEQSRAIEPSAPGRRKIVLATNIAETSLTIEGVDVVVDSGLVREPVFDPATAMTRLQTVRISAASSIQRMGRAGRLRAGRCYRLWSSSQQDQLAPHAAPEIRSADLAPMALLLLAWGIGDPNELDWMDAPPAGAWQQAIALLDDLEALDRPAEGPVLSPTGEAMASLPVHPRLAHMLLRGASVGEGQAACRLAAHLSDRDPFTDDPDLAHRLAVLEGSESCPPRQRGWMQRTLRLADQFEAQLKELSVERRAIRLPGEDAAGFLIACAYPDRIARRRQSGGYQLANGRSASFQAASRLAKHRWLAVAEVGGLRGSRGDSIRSAAALARELFDHVLAGVKRDVTVCEWDKRSGRFVAERRQMIGALVLSAEVMDDVPAGAKAAMLSEHIREEGLDVLGTGKAFRNWQARVQLAAEVLGLPDMSDEALLATLEDWLAPYLEGVQRLDDLRKLDVRRILSDQMDYDMKRQLDRLVPEHIEVPSGSKIVIDYTASPPLLAVKLQEMFGCIDAPTVLDGNVRLQVHLLSPAGRPLQVTQDLAHFWREGYESVRKEMKGRYPKHPWPADPITAEPTRKTRPRKG